MPVPVFPDDARLLGALASGSRGLISARFWGMVSMRCWPS
ncbi:hypothetical protein Q427_19255 [Halomonas sp. BC04]|nr:hypothetical protein Q427_19255 [Halomonas sp. BC04]